MFFHLKGLLVNEHCPARKFGFLKREVETLHDQAVLESIKLTIPAKMSFFYIANETARHYALMAGFSEEDIYKIQLSLEETIGIIIYNGFAEWEKAPSLDINIAISDPYGIVIRIEDKGMPFDPLTAPHHDTNRAIEDQQIFGFGLKLVKGLMDKVEYLNLGKDGKSTLLTKYCPAPLHIPEPSDRLGARSEESHDYLKAPLEFTVRRLKREEAIEVSRCAYKSHGYTFFDDVIYYPEKIWDMNEKDLMISAVAVTRRNEFMGHGAILLSEPGARTGEISFVFVDEKFRQNDCLGRIGDLLIKTAIEKNFTGIYCYAVTIHVISQKACVKVGFHSLAILLGTAPKTWVFKGITENLSQRISYIIFFHYLHRPKPRRIYSPARHVQIIRQFYSTLGASHIIEETSGDMGEYLEEQSVIDMKIDEMAGSAELWIFRAGPDIDSELSDALRRLCTGGIASIALFVSMEDQTAQRYTETFEGMGFFFSGILPETPIGDALILQYLNNIDIDYAAINILPGDPEMLLNYIRSCDPNLGNKFH